MSDDGLKCGNWVSILMIEGWRSCLTLLSRSRASFPKMIHEMMSWKLVCDSDAFDEKFLVPSKVSRCWMFRCGKSFYDDSDQRPAASGCPFLSTEKWWSLMPMFTFACDDHSLKMPCKLYDVVVTAAWEHFLKNAFFGSRFSLSLSLSPCILMMAVLTQSTSSSPQSNLKGNRGKENWNERNQTWNMPWA